MSFPRLQKRSSQEKKTVKKKESSAAPKNNGVLQDIDPQKAKLKKEFLSAYTTGKGSLPDMTRLEKGSNSFVRRFVAPLIALILVVGGIGYVGYRIFNQGSLYQGNNVHITVDGPFEATVGSYTTYTITYANQDRVALRNMRLEVIYPEGFVYDSASRKPSNAGQTLWELGTIEPRERLTLTVSGWLWGEEDTTAELAATLTFHPRDFLIRFTEKRVQSTKLRGSVFAFLVDNAPQVLVGEEVDYMIEFVRPYDERPFDEARLVVSTPSHFSLTSSTPTLLEDEKGAKYWNIHTLEEGVTPELKGVYTEKKTDEEESSDAEAPHPNALTFFVEVRSPQEEVFVVARTDVLPDIVIGDILASLIVDGSRAEISADFGDILPVSLVVRNKGEAVVESVTVTLREEEREAQEPSFILWDALETITKAEREDDMLIWTSQEVDIFEQLESDKEKTLDLTLPLMTWLRYKELTDSGSLPESRQPRVVLQARGTYTNDEEGHTQTFESNKVIIQLSTPLTAKAEVRYFDEDNIAVGAGPLPPRVGATTSYQVLWMAETVLHDLKDIAMRTTLPEGVVWGDRSLVDAGDVEFNPVSRQVLWRLNALPVKIGESHMYFTVTVTPTADQVNTLLTLTGETTLEATDAITGAMLRKNFMPLTSDLEHDPVITGKGIVQPKEGI